MFPREGSRNPSEENDQIDGIKRAIKQNWKKTTRTQASTPTQGNTGVTVERRGRLRRGQEGDDRTARALECPYGGPVVLERVQTDLARLRGGNEMRGK